MVRLTLATSLAAAFISGITGHALATEITPSAINEATYSGDPFPEDQSAITARIQILLDRHHASPGVIDGHSGKNVSKAIRGFEERYGLPADGTMDQEVWGLLAMDNAPPMILHTITEEDVSRIVAPLPEDYSELAELEWLGFTSAAEKIAERFHMDIEFLRQMNPDASFAQGEQIWVADPGDDATTDVTRIVADKFRQRLLAYADDGSIVASYPVTIGSAQNRSPSGTHEVSGIAVEASYTYSPEVNFTQGDNAEQLVLPPGPNGPVGIVWIDLSEPTYGIHGTAEPAEIDKTFSHGCVRMTNWDAMELAELVSVGIPVEFRD